MNRPILAAVAGLAVLGMTAAGAYVIVSPGGEEEVVQLQETATPAATDSTDPPTPHASATPSDELPPADEGYVWYTSPASSPTLFSVQVPADWESIEDATFVPAGLPPSFPYPPVPQITVHSAAVNTTPPDSHPGWQHPFVWRVGSQGGGGCEGDVSASMVRSSATYSAAGYTWDTYVFTCTVTELNYPPGVIYDGRAAELRTDGVVVYVLAFDMPGSDVSDAGFQEALQTFQLR